ncbi:hypothetical protein DOTSEDRAFT_147049 [Dothistroma septosporum NZE10]|uniref:rRNA-processing protein FYV7 n=1 Tax=Dothistroma septosporum (strain NZE10 / CBS 128990) TaxID=675120 RepID=N1PZZ9_DOTSN|nr:hypothetical protein DOTSEDRAFT_147049 [Dothistroma septosporum NZE10]
MSEKRKRDRDDGDAKDERKKQRKGFRVGPDNLPDGVWKRKNQEIKQNLIGKAKIYKEFAKLKKQGRIPEQEESLPQPASLALDEEKEKETEVDTAPHPDRQTLIEREAEEPEETQPRRTDREPRRRKPKPMPFKKEHEEALQRKAEAEGRREAREAAQQERQQKIEEREKFRKAMSKARTGGWNGQRKLGRESKPLLEKVKRIMGDS